MTLFPLIVKYERIILDKILNLDILPVLIGLENKLLPGSEMKYLGYKKYNCKITRVFFYNCHRVKSLLLSLELSFKSLLHGRQTCK